MSTSQIMQGYMSKYVLLGWGGSGLYFIAELFNNIAGMILTAAMVITSVILQWVKIKAAIAEEKRKQELHEQEMRQDNETHNKSLN